MGLGRHGARSAHSPEVVGPEVALPPLGGSQLDKGAARGVEDAEDSDADTEDDHPVADDHPCGAAVGSTRWTCWGDLPGSPAPRKGVLAPPHHHLLLGPQSKAQKPLAPAAGHLVIRAEPRPHGPPLVQSRQLGGFPARSRGALHCCPPLHARSPRGWTAELGKKPTASAPTLPGVSQQPFPLGGAWTSSSLNCPGPFHPGAG